MHRLLHLPLVILVAGGLLLLGATLWSHFKDPRDYWQGENAETLTQAGLEYHGEAHRMAHAHGGTPDATMQKKYEQARTQYEQRRGMFEEAQQRYERPGRLMWWSGMACLAVGIVAYYLVRSAGRE